VGINVIDNVALAKTISDGAAQLLADGLSLEDHLPGVVQAAVDVELAKVTALVAPLLDRIDAINSTATALIAESAHWRTLIGRLFNLSV
jgi:hypothetical protein